MIRRVTATLLTCIVIVGCGSDDSNEAQMVRTGAPSTATKADGTLVSFPAPLTLGELDKLPAGSARYAVFDMLFWAQWGSWSNVLDAYDPVVRDALTNNEMAGSFALLRPQLVGSRPVFKGSRLESGRVSLQVELLSKANGPIRESFLLRRREGRWRIVADTLLERGLRAYVQESTSRNPEGAPEPAALRAGLRAAARYRAAYLDDQDRSRDIVGR